MIFTRPIPLSPRRLAALLALAAGTWAAVLPALQAAAPAPHRPPGTTHRTANSAKKTGGRKLSPLEKALRRPNRAPTASDITADRMELDLNAHVARFEGHVRVTDPRMTLTAETMIITFDQNNQLKTLEAMGAVRINQPDADREAIAGHARYDVAKGTIELSENPALRNGLNLLTGPAKIIYYRDSDRVETVGGHPHIRIIPKKGKAPVLPALLNKINGRPSKPQRKQK